MKTKTSIATLVAMIAFSSHAQTVQYGKVTAVSPIETMVQVTEPRSVCTQVQVPIYHDVPVQVLVETPVVSQVQTNPAAPVLGMLIGAAIGNRAFSGDARLAGTFLGAAVGTSLGETSSRHTIVTTQPTYVTQYRRELKDVRYRDECRTIYESVVRSVVNGYNVTYTLNGTSKTVVMNSRPGDFVKVITSTTIEP